MGDQRSCQMYAIHGGFYQLVSCQRDSLGLTSRHSKDTYYVAKTQMKMVMEVQLTDQGMNQMYSIHSLVWLPYL